jgi:hypothetical protein
MDKLLLDMVLSKNLSRTFRGSEDEEIQFFSRSVHALIEYTNATREEESSSGSLLI